MLLQVESSIAQMPRSSHVEPSSPSLGTIKNDAQTIDGYAEFIGIAVATPDAILNNIKHLDD
jgi:hypothetical protein